jgi:hypothetical protein
LPNRTFLIAPDDAGVLNGKVRFGGSFIVVFLAALFFVLGLYGVFILFRMFLPA